MNKKVKGKYWFPAKKYGFGWGFPVVWQGWLFLLTWAAAVFIGIAYIEAQLLSAYVFSAFVFVMVLILVAVCLVKGERPI
ncbi:MAG: hypothetical protein ACSHWQ_01240 [Spongiibacteraceae bacterium]